MRRHFVGVAVAIVLVITVSFAQGQQRGRGGEKPGKGGESQHKGGDSRNRGGESRNKGGESRSKGDDPSHRGGDQPGHESGGRKAPGGEWSDSPGRKPSSQGQDNHEPQGKAKSPEQSVRPGTNSGSGANLRNKDATPAGEATAGAAAVNRKQGSPSGADAAAAGAAASNRRNPNPTNADAAAAGAAAATRNNPSATTAESAAVGAAAANRNNPALTSTQAAAVGAAAANGNPSNNGSPEAYAAVRNSFDHPNVYSQGWHDDHPEAWNATNWAANDAWTAASMAEIASHCGYPATAVSYGYGQNVTNQGGNVLHDGQVVGTSEEFSQQAADLAQIGQQAEASADGDWLPIGVFALVRSEEQHAQLTVQLAINKQGILRGNYTDLVSDHTQPIEGSVDKQTQRAAWTVGENKNFIMEAGLSNLTSGEAPALIHKHNRTEKWLLISLPKPDSEDTVSAPQHPER